MNRMFFGQYLVLVIGIIVVVSIECVITSLITFSLLTYTVYRPPCPWTDEPRRQRHR